MSHLFGLLLKLIPPCMSSPTPQIRTDEGISMRVAAWRRVPTGLHEENVRHVLECAEAFGILIALPRLDTLELLQWVYYLVSTPGSNEDIDSLRASAWKSFCSPISDGYHLDASAMSPASSLSDAPHSRSSFLADYESALRMHLSKLFAEKDVLTMCWVITVTWLSHIHVTL